jgi:hypothetical protein
MKNFHELIALGGKVNYSVVFKKVVFANFVKMFWLDEIHQLKNNIVLDSHFGTIFWETTHPIKSIFYMKKQVIYSFNLTVPIF